ncbi:putative Ig domain-containing protein [Geothermobacter hydrogeniphilus]|nr:putative Ig domain-containing protein [Geothermobacter hydrogeniphilus]
MGINVSRVLLFMVGLTLAITTAVNAKTITMTWDASSDSRVTGYKIYYSTTSPDPPFNGTGANEGPSPIDVGNNLTATLSGLVNEQVHYLAVTAYDAAGNESDYSNIAVSSAILPQVNRPPVLATIGSRTVTARSTLSFVLSASDPDGDTLVYSVVNLPPGASFNAATGSFSWTPADSAVGSYSPTFSVSDGSLSDSETVTIEVAAYVPPDSDGDGVIDSQDAFPLDASEWLDTDLDGIGNNADPDDDNDGVIDSQDAFPLDASEWLDTDLDGIGNNADPDDDNDGVIDSRDSAPLDAATSAWRISAVAGSGGTITPSGDSLLPYGQSQSYIISAAAGFFLEDVLVDGTSVGPVEQYQFVAVDSSHRIEALFQPVADGLRLPASESGLPGVDRLDGGDDSSNLVGGVPKSDLDYLFRIVLQDTSGNAPAAVMLILNGYAYPMTLQSGILAAGATYGFTTHLGPMASQFFHFEARDAQGTVLFRFPAEGELDAPRIELLNGRNIVGIPTDPAVPALTADQAFGASPAYQWFADGKKTGHYQLVSGDSGLIAGTGYVIKRAAVSQLPAPDPATENPAPSCEIPLQKGWNLIANPYGGNVALADIQVQVDGSAPLTWSDAVAAGQVIDGVYSFVGEDWGNRMILYPGDDPDAVLVPGIGYWIYVNSENDAVSLVVPRPQT